MSNKLLKILISCMFLTMLFATSVFANEEEEDTVDLGNIWEELQQTSAKETKEPVLNSRAAVVIETSTNKILFEKNAEEKRPMASTTKIMTAIIVLEQADLNKTVEVTSKAAGIGGSRLGLKKGDKISVNDLLYGLMLCSRK